MATNKFSSPRGKGHIYPWVSVGKVSHSRDIFSVVLGVGHLHVEGGEVLRCFRLQYVTISRVLYKGKDRRGIYTKHNDDAINNKSSSLSDHSSR